MGDDGAVLLSPWIWIGAGVVVAVVAAWRVLLWRFAVTPGPNELLVLTGRERKRPDGSVVDYRVVRGGSALRIPLIEKLARLDVSRVPVLVRVTDVSARGSVPMLIEATVELRIAADDDHIDEAIRRFLGCSRAEIASASGSLLEVHLRGIAGRRKPEELVAAPERLASSIATEARLDLLECGLEIAGVEIEHISDPTGYLTDRGVHPFGTPVQSPSFGQGLGRSREELSSARDRQRSIVSRPKADEARAQLGELYRRASWLERRVLLSDLDSPDLEPLVETLIEACGDQDPTTQLALAQALGRIGSPVGVPWLARAADSAFTGLARGASDALDGVREGLQAAHTGAEVGALSIVDEARGHLSMIQGDGRLALFDRVHDLAADQLEETRPVLDVHRWSAVSPPPRRVSPLLVADTLLWARGNGPFAWVMVLLTAATVAWFPAEWADGIPRVGVLFFFGAYAALVLYIAASNAVEDLRLFSRGAATLGEVVNVGAFDRFDHDLETQVSGFDYTIRYVAADGKVTEAKLRRSRRIAAVGDEALEPLLHLPGAGSEDVLMVDEMGPITVRSDGGLSVRSARSLLTPVLIAATVLVVVSQLP